MKKKNISQNQGSPRYRETSTNKLKKSILRAHQNLKEGKVSFLSLEKNFPRLSNYIYGIAKGDQVIVTASSGIGKTRFTKHLFVKVPIRQAQKNPTTDLHIIYNTMEEPVETFTLDMIRSMMSVRYGKELTRREVRGVSKEPLDETTLEEISNCADFIGNLEEKYLDIVDIKDVTRFYTYCIYKLSSLGIFLDKYNNQVSVEQVISGGIDSFQTFQYHNPNTLLIIIVDTVNNFGLSSFEKHSQMSLWSSEYSRYVLTKKCNVISVLVQQQVQDKEKMVLTFKGKIKEEIFYPSLADLANNKLTQRDATIVLGLFSPERYGIREFGSNPIYKINDGTGSYGLGNKFKPVFLLKDRDGANPNLVIPLFDKGYEFLELTNDERVLNRLYEKLKK